MQRKIIRIALVSAISVTAILGASLPSHASSLSEQESVYSEIDNENRAPFYVDSFHFDRNPEARHMLTLEDAIAVSDRNQGVLFARLTESIEFEIDNEDGVIPFNTFDGELGLLSNGEQIDNFNRVVVGVTTRNGVSPRGIGALVINTAEEGPGHVAGLHPGDVILQLDGMWLLNGVHWSESIALMQEDETWHLLVVDQEGNFFETNLIPFTNPRHGNEPFNDGTSNLVLNSLGIVFFSIVIFIVGRRFERKTQAKAKARKKTFQKDLKKVKKKQNETKYSASLIETVTPELPMQVLPQQELAINAIEEKIIYLSEIQDAEDIVAQLLK